MKDWTPQEDEVIRKNWKNMNARQLMELLPDRSIDSIAGRRKRLSLLKGQVKLPERVLRQLKDYYPLLGGVGMASKFGGNPCTWQKRAGNRNIHIRPVIHNPTDLILAILRKTTVPVEDKEIIEKIGADKIDPPTLEREIKGLQDDGYDIKRIVSGRKSFYTLIRQVEVDRDYQYRVLGEISTPFLLAPDWHIGSVGFSPQAFKLMVEDVKIFDVKDVLVPGDIVQGKGVHSVELLDLKDPNIDSQVNSAVSYIRSIPAKVHMVIGNHEEKIKGKTEVGYDPLAHIAQRCDNAVYYGAVAKLLLDKKYSVLMIHSSGGITYATSYKQEKLWRELIERSNILCTGHTHVFSITPKPRNQLLLQAGTLQRENSYLIQKGIISQIGWIVVLKYNDQEVHFYQHMPQVH